MTRDNFTQATKNLLGLAVGFVCVRPGCARPTTALAQSSNEITRLGTAAHDSAAAVGGPRYDNALTPEQRKAYDNGAHLCPNCARLVDIDSERFPQGTIALWQKKAAEYRQYRMHTPYPPFGLDFKTGCEAALKFIDLCKQIQVDMSQRTVSWQSISAMGELLRKSYPMAAINPYCAQFPHMVNLQQEMISSIRLIEKEIRYSGFWLYDQNFGTYYSPLNISTDDPISKSYQLVLSRFEDFLENKQNLHSIARSPYPSIDLYSW